ncbi:MAG: HRDC domain-containing protein [Planctomycetota bacterium]
MTERIHHVETPEALHELARSLEGAPLIGVDTESDSLHCYFEKVCYLQIECEGEIFLVDTIRLRDLAPLRPVFADPETLKILHGADYDVLCLSRDFDLRFDGLFDTMVAAQFVGRTSLGLAALCEEFFGVRMDKSLTRHNWALRPLEEKYLEYMAADVRHLADLEEILDRELEEADLLEEYEAECDWLTTQVWVDRPFDDEGWRRIKGARDLPPASRPALKALFLLRDRIARQRDLPAYKVMNNEFLLAVARDLPRTARELGRDRRWAKTVARHGADILEALRAARDGEIEIPRRAPPEPDAEEKRELAEELRRWRAKAAKRENLASVVVMPKHAMVDIVERRPRTRDELAAIPYITGRRVEKYGDEILALLDH